MDHPEEAQLQEVLDRVRAECVRQAVRWGEQNHPDGTGPDQKLMPLPDRAAPAARVATRYCEQAAAAGQLTWLHVLREEVYEALAENDPGKLAAELTQAAAVTVSWQLALARRNHD